MAWYKPWTWGDESQSTQQKRADLNTQGGAASGFAGVGEQGYGAMTGEAGAARDYLRRLSTGEESLSREQLRQDMERNVAAQRSAAAGASPANAPMAARTAAIQMGRIGTGLAGQTAMAGIAERQAAQKAYMDSILQQRQQDAQVALNSRQNATTAYGGVAPEASTLDKWANPITGALGGIAKFSDKRLKEEIEDGDVDANTAMKRLRAYTYKYKDKKLGKDRELGVMAQELEGAGLKHAVIETPRGKAVHGAALATANTAMLAALERRVAKIEGK